MHTPPVHLTSIYKYHLTAISGKNRSMELDLRLALPDSNNRSTASHLDAGDNDQSGGGGGVGGGGEVGDGWAKSSDVDGGCGGRRRRGRCVKVKMDGVGIGRKVDVSLHHSYQALFHTLKHMFPINRHDVEIKYDEYVITYENERGDWMVVGDVPWEAFIKSVKQLKILK